jgi:tyrosyl-tRNA synthetase
MSSSDIARSLEILRRGTVSIISEAELAEKLSASAKTGRPLRVKYGADPSAPDIHLGHTVPLRKLREFQDLGHLVVFIIGDFTALVGDPSGRSQTRKGLSREQVAENAWTYQEQVFKILDPARTEVVFNSSWLAPLTFAGVLDLASRYTVARMLERDDFHQRYREGLPISILEFLYPLMQGYDSVAVKADVEIGGTDQTFNLLVAREIQKEYGLPPQAVITLPLLEGTDGVRKMSKSLGNYIGVSEDPREIYGKVMSVSDVLMWRYYDLLSRSPPEEIARGREECAHGTANPMEWKKRLAFELAERFSSPEAARQAEAVFQRVTIEKKPPEDMAIHKISREELREGRISSRSIVDLLVKAGIAASKSEAWRKFSEGAVRLNANKIIAQRPLSSRDEKWFPLDTQQRNILSLKHTFIEIKLE